VKQTGAKNGNEKVSTDHLVQETAREFHCAADGWLAVSILVQGAAKVDLIWQLQDFPCLAEIGRGNLLLMMSLTAKTHQMKSFHLKHSSDKELAHAPT